MAIAGRIAGWLYQKLGGVGARRIGRNRFDAIADPVERLAVSESYPDWMVRRFVAELGLDEAAKLCAAMNRRAPLTARANRLKNTREEHGLATAREVASHLGHRARCGLELETNVNAYGLRAFKEGRFELQDAASQIVAGGGCAAARRGGGRLRGRRAARRWRWARSCKIAGGCGALDVAERKLVQLRKRARRAALTNVQACVNLPQVKADRVLCDAPCSGLGVLRRHPEARWRLSPEDLRELPKKQREILEALSAALVAPGRPDHLFHVHRRARTENDAVFDNFLAAHPELEAVPAKSCEAVTERARWATGCGCACCRRFTTPTASLPRWRDCVSALQALPNAVGRQRAGRSPEVPFKVRLLTVPVLLLVGNVCGPDA